MLLPPLLQLLCPNSKCLPLSNSWPEWTGAALGLWGVEECPKGEAGEEKAPW